MNTNANAFFPRRVTIKSQDGREVDLVNWRKGGVPASPVVENNPSLIHQTYNPKRTSAIRMETVEAKEKRLAEEKERIRREEEAKKAAEEERIRKEKEEEERKAAEAEKLRLAKEAEERRVKEEEKKVAAKLAEEQKPEEGEIIESPTSEEPPKEVREVFSRKEGLKIDTAITKARPGPLDLSGATKNVAAAPPSALATARIIEDLGHISYPEGVISPKPELNVNSKKGKFR